MAPGGLETRLGERLKGLIQVFQGLSEPLQACQTFPNSSFQEAPWRPPVLARIFYGRQGPVVWSFPARQGPGSPEVSPARQGTRGSLTTAQASRLPTTIFSISYMPIRVRSVHN